MANPEEIWAVNSEWCQGIGPGYWPVSGTGLSLNLTAGTAFISGVIYRVGAATLTMTDNTTNYIYLDSTGNPATKTTAFTASDIPIATITTLGGVITNVEDDRNYFISPPALYLIAFFQGDATLAGPLANNQILLRHKIPSSVNNVVLPINLTGSTGGCITNPTATATITIKLNPTGANTTLGTISISTSGVMTFSFASAVTLVPSDILEFKNQNPADTTLSGVFWSISGAKG
jgi:hypothetical protein